MTVAVTNDLENGTATHSHPAGELKHPELAAGLASSSDGSTSTLGKFDRSVKGIERRLVKYNLEARGIQRVLPEETHPVTWLSYLQAFRTWFSINLAANNITLGMLGPAIFGLSFKDAALCGVFGALLGSIPPAVISTWGPLSGNRTLVFARYTFGWWPTKVLVILTIIINIGYSMIDLVIAGQMLSAVSANGSLNIVVGIIIVGVICWVISTFGIRIFHLYQRYAWFPQIIAFSILYGTSAKHFDLATPSAGSSVTRTASRISFFSLCFSAAITYTGFAADFFVYYSPKTSRPLLFAANHLALLLSFTYAFLIGIGLASGVPTNETYSTAYTTSQGALIVEGLAPLHGFGKFVAVIILFSLVANILGPSYSIGIDFQLLARYAEKVPRFIWNTAGVIIYTVCALAGRDHLAAVFTNFLALMGYWVAIWVVVTWEEQFLFRGKTGYDWTLWNKQSQLPMGLAAFAAFLAGWAGAILCMAQVWYIGPIAALVGEHGADLGNYVGASWAMLVYPPLRWLELKKFGR